MSTVYNFGNRAIVCHAFNADSSLVAVSHNTHEIFIYAAPASSDGKFELRHVLAEHSAPVMGLDWAPRTNRIVSCSSDRSAYVWVEADGVWKPVLVNLQFTRAATCVRWAPQENKFAVGSGAKTIAICHYVPESDFWLSHIIKNKLRSSVLGLDWHPSGLLLAVASSDFKARVFTAHLSALGEEVFAGESWSVPSEENKGKRGGFGKVVFEGGEGYGGWIRAIAFSPDGSRLVWTGHDSSLSLVDSSRGLQTVTTLRHHYLPFTSVAWLSEESIVAAGHDCTPLVFATQSAVSSGELCLIFVDNLEQERVREEGKKLGVMMAAMKKFQDIDRMATTDKRERLDTMHQKTIREIRVQSQSGRVQLLTSVGDDGHLVMWDLSNLEQRFAKLNIH